MRGSISLKDVDKTGFVEQDLQYECIILKHGSLFPTFLFFSYGDFFVYSETWNCCLFWNVFLIAVKYSL